MTFTNPIEKVTEIYRFGEVASIYWRSIKFPELQLFAFGVQRLMSAVGELDPDTHWAKFFRRLRQFRFICMATTYSREYLSNQLESIISELDHNEKPFSQTYPDSFPAYQALKVVTKRLASVDLAQIIQEIVKEHSRIGRQGGTLVLVPETRFVSKSEKALMDAGLNNIEVTSPPYLRDDVAFENIIVVGPTRWFPEYVFTAPRSDNMLVIKYAWITDRWKREHDFSDPLKSKMGSLVQVVFNDEYEGAFDPSEMLPPTFDFQGIRNRVAAEIRGRNDVEYVQAKPVLLEEDWVVLIESDESASVLVIDLREVESPVTKIKANQIEPGVFILLRSGGGGDFIVPVADQIMGNEGIKARECQKRWKELLREQVVLEGYDKIVACLLELGSTRANPTNLRNWMSPRSIKTEYRNDFDAIMKHIGLHYESDINWSLMEKIDHAHRKAGHTIREMLLKKVKTSDLSSLKRTGKMNFELDAEAKISITAFQVKSVLPETLQVLPWRIGVPIKQGDED